MRLSKTEAKLFFKLHAAILVYANRKKKVFEKIETVEDLEVAPREDLMRLTDTLWQHSHLIDDFVKDNYAMDIKDISTVVLERME